MAADEQDLEARRRRAIFRAGHRGTKEMDWILGRFADAQVAAMNENDLGAFELFLEYPDPEIEQWIVHSGDGHPGGAVGAFVERVRRFHELSG